MIQIEEHYHYHRRTVDMGVEYDAHDEESFLRGVTEAQTNRHPYNGEPLPLRTSESQRTEKREGLTTYTVSELMQGMGAYTPRGIAYDAFNQTISGDLGHFIDSEGGVGGTLKGRGPLLAYDIAAGRRGFDDGIFTQESGLPGINAGVGSVTGSEKPSTTKSRPSGQINAGDTPQAMGLENGKIPEEYLVKVGIPENDSLPGAITEHMLWEPAALDFLDMMDAMEAESSYKRTQIGETYRTYRKQEYFWNCYQTGSCNNGNLAARPGTSNHGWGIAIDFDAAYDWIQANGQRFNWIWGEVQSERWHFTWRP